MTEPPAHVTELFSRRPSAGTEIACDLSVLDAPAEHERAFEELWEERLDVRKVKGGFAARFPGGIDYAERLLAFAARERRCCPFLTIEIALEPEERGTWLYLGGDERVERYIDARLEDVIRGDA